MSVDMVMGIMGQALKVTLLISAPALLVGLAVGIAVSIFQAVTQIQEMTLVFVPKILAVMFALLVALPWMLNLLLTFTRNLISNLPMYIR